LASQNRCIVGSAHTYKAQEGNNGIGKRKEFLFQPWRFVVVEDQEFKQKLVQTIFPIWKKSTESMKETHPEIYEKVMMQYEAMDEPKDMIYHGAPVILFVIGLATHAISCALACENIMIAATSLGLGSCYVGVGAMVKGDADVVKALDLKEGERIYGPIVLGYPKDEDALAFPSWRQTMIPITKMNYFMTKLPKGLFHKPQRTIVRLKNGSIIQAFPNNPNNLRGFTLQIVYCDEMNFIPNDEEMYDAIRFTLATTNGKFIASSTPWTTDSVFWKLFH
jgi:nitroreductase